MRQYTTIEPRPNNLPPIQHTYHGFNRDFSIDPLYVAVVLFEDVQELWALTSEKYLTQLKQFIQNSELYPDNTRVLLYKEVLKKR